MQVLRVIHITSRVLEKKDWGSWHSSFHRSQGLSGTLTSSLAAPLVLQISPINPCDQYNEE